jgi:hypothetical protein
MITTLEVERFSLTSSQPFEQGDLPRLDGRRLNLEWIHSFLHLHI